MDNVISLNDALQIFKQKDHTGMYVTFSLKYRTFNSCTKQGGKLINYEGVRYLPSAKAMDIKKAKTKNPHHFKNRTRNIELPTGEIKTIGIDYMISINNQLIIY